MMIVRTSLTALAAAALFLPLASGALAGVDVQTYSVVFESTWSAETHATDFPGNPHYSGLVGGSHDDTVSFWSPGGLATEGIRRMAEQGSKSVLMDEVQSALTGGSADAVLCGPSMSLSPGVAFMTMDVDSDYSLITLVSMLAPSPDWFVGVDGLDLRDGDGWRDEVIVDLRVWDAGTDSGPTYTSSNMPTSPQEPIADITDAYPFFGVTVGTFRFTRQTVGVEDVPTVAVTLSAARPNPSRARTAVTLSLTSDTSVVAEVFDAGGRRVRRLVDQTLSGGSHAVVWDGRTEQASIAPAGVYFLRVNLGGERQETVRITRVR